MVRCYAMVLVAAVASSQELKQLEPHNVKQEAVVYKGRTAIRVTSAGPANLTDGARLAIMTGPDFQDGTITVELAGDVMPGMGDTYRGFTGIAFRVTPGGAGYECFYLRPRNGRSENQEQRNHSAQYISFPEFPWQRLRSQTPGRYESYVDLVPGEWTKVKIEVKGDKARLYVHDADQPTLVVNDLKHGVSKGAVALWVGPGVVAHFTNLRISAARR